MGRNNEKMQSSKFDKIGKYLENDDFPLSIFCSSLLLIDQTLDSMRSGDGGHDGYRGAKPNKSIPLGPHQANQAMSGAGGYGLSMFPANKYDQQQQQHNASKASKGTANIGALPSNNDQQSIQNQIQKSHQ